LLFNIFTIIENLVHNEYNILLQVKNKTHNTNKVLEYYPELDRVSNIN